MTQMIDEAAEMYWELDALKEENDRLRRANERLKSDARFYDEMIPGVFLVSRHESHSKHLVAQKLYANSTLVAERVARKLTAITATDDLLQPAARALQEYIGKVSMEARDATIASLRKGSDATQWQIPSQSDIANHLASVLVEAGIAAPRKS